MLEETLWKTFFLAKCVPKIYSSKDNVVVPLFGSVHVLAFIKSGSRLNKTVKFC